MVLPAALPFAGAALRVMRTAAGRRALQVTLVLGGLFALGLLCEGQAHAADGTPIASAAPPAAWTQAGTATADSPSAGRGSPKATAHQGRRAASAGRVSRVGFPVPPSGPQADAGGTGGAPTSLAPPTTEVVRPVVDGPVRPVVEGPVRPVVEGLVRPVGGTVVRPVGVLVQAVTEGRADASRQWPPLPSLLDSPPSLPGRPPGLPGVPVAPGLPTPAVHTLPAPQGVAEQRETGAYGPRTAGSPGVTPVPYTRPAPHDVRTEHTHPHRMPYGDPSRVCGDQPAADAGTPRHGDGHAVVSGHPAPVGLVPGGTAAVTADGTRGRPRDIPEFPG
ncbi:hypothetical protein ACFYZJ_24780 [Streptomyces sp. NPDC001848]|uniref:hypothetical protein n=1 Tax=Streptomyces sp. NPDC001848 TaxID=3364618 RepID=UPI0036B9F1EB